MEEISKRQVVDLWRFTWLIAVKEEQLLKDYVKEQKERTKHRCWRNPTEVLKWSYDEVADFFKMNKS